jgi:hypothetical protein
MGPGLRRDDGACVCRREKAALRSSPSSAAVVQSIDVRKEMQEELLNLYNYASLLDDEILGSESSRGAVTSWQKLEDTGVL